MELATTIAAWVGAVAGLGSLALQAWSRRRPAHRLQVSRAAAWFFPPNEAMGTVDTLQVVAVTAHNVGASAVTVTAWGVRMPNGQDYVSPMPIFGSDTVPHRLESGAEVTFYMRQAELRSRIVEDGIDPRSLRAWVRLATREQIYAPAGVPGVD